MWMSSGRHKSPLLHYPNVDAQLSSWAFSFARQGLGPVRLFDHMTNSSPASGPDGLAPPHLYWATLAIALSVIMAVMDSSIANIALPVIGRELQVSDSASVWVVNSYQLAVTMALFPLAGLGELIGYRRVHIGGLILFVAASLLCALSKSLPLLSVARVFQGLGGAGMLSVNMALIRVVFPRDRLGAGIGMNAMVGSLATAIGPTVAALILSVASWPWLFAVNVPIGLFALYLSWRIIPRSAHNAKRFDILGATLCAATLGLFIIGVDGFSHDQPALIFLSELAGAVVIGTILVQHQKQQQDPLLPLDLLRRPLFSLSVSASICCFAAQGLAYVAMPFLLQNQLHLSQFTTGLLLTFWPVTVAIISPIAGRLADIFPPAVLGGIGLMLTAIGLALVACLPDHPSNLDIAWRMALCGFGFGFFNAPNNRAIISSAPPHRSGGASGMVATARILGQSLGAALVALCFEISQRHGTVIALLAGAGFAAAAAIASFMRRFTVQQPSTP